MGSPVTLSGFNQIDFTSILNAIMQQERQPVTALETQKRALEAQKTAFGTLASRFSSLESAAENLVDAEAFNATAATVSDSTRLSVSASSTAPTGSYEIYVDQLARAQVSTSAAASAYANTDTTLVAGAGTLRLTTAEGSVDVVLEGDVTLDQLAEAINDTADAPVSASVFRNTDGKYQLMLTGRETGADHAFTVDASAFAAPSGGGSVMSFASAQTAQDAQVRVNGVTATSSTNVFDGLISGLSFTALKQDVTNPVTVTITASYDSVVNLVQKVVAAFNDTSSFISDQAAAAARGEQNNIGRDALVRGLRSRLSSVLTGSYDVGGSVSSLAEVGFEFTRSGQLTFNETKFRDAIASDKTSVERIFRGSDGTGGAFGSLVSAIEEYTAAGGLVPNAQNRVSDQLTRLSDRIGDMEERLAIRRDALQKEFLEADRTLSQLNAQSGSLSSLGSQFRLF